MFKRLKKFIDYITFDVKLDETKKMQAHLKELGIESNLVPLSRSKLNYSIPIEDPMVIECAEGAIEGIDVIWLSLEGGGRYSSSYWVARYFVLGEKDKEGLFAHTKLIWEKKRVEGRKRKERVGVRWVGERIADRLDMDKKLNDSILKLVEEDQLSSIWVRYFNESATLIEVHHGTKMERYQSRETLDAISRIADHIKSFW